MLMTAKCWRAHVDGLLYCIVGRGFIPLRYCGDRSTNNCTPNLLSVKPNKGLDDIIFAVIDDSITSKSPIIYMYVVYNNIDMKIL